MDPIQSAALIAGCCTVAGCGCAAVDPEVLGTACYSGCNNNSATQNYSSGAQSGAQRFRRRLGMAAIFDALFQFLGCAEIGRRACLGPDWGNTNGSDSHELGGSSRHAAAIDPSFRFDEDFLDWRLLNATEVSHIPVAESQTLKTSCVSSHLAKGGNACYSISVSRQHTSASSASACSLMSSSLDGPCCSTRSHTESDQQGIQQNDFLFPATNPTESAILPPSQITEHVRDECGISSNADDVTLNDTISAEMGPISSTDYLSVTESGTASCVESVMQNQKAQSLPKSRKKEDRSSRGFHNPALKRSVSSALSVQSTPFKYTAHSAKGTAAPTSPSHLPYPGRDNAVINEDDEHQSNGSGSQTDVTDLTEFGPLSDASGKQHKKWDVNIRQQGQWNHADAFFRDLSSRFIKRQQTSPASLVGGTHSRPSPFLGCRNATQQYDPFAELPEPPSAFFLRKAYAQSLTLQKQQTQSIL